MLESMTMCWLSTVVLLLSVISGVSAEDISVELKSPGGNATLSCGDLSGPITWWKNNAVLPDSNNGTLIVHKVSEKNQVGVYTCNNSDSSRTVILYAAAVVVKKSSAGERSVTLTQGDDLELKCLAWGYPMPIIKWKKATRWGDDDAELTSNDRVSLMEYEQLINGKLTISNVTKEDYGKYTCIAENGYEYSGDTNNNYNSTSTLVRVKDKLTPLWPLIGIIIEIVILLVIIVVYEKRKTKQSDNEVKDETAVSNSNDHNEQVRLRK